MHSLKVFGSLAFASTLHMHRTKLEPRGRKCVFLGYKNGMKGVILYDINSHTILVSRNVIHHEHIFPYSNVNSTNWTYHPYKDPNDSPQNEPIIHVPSQNIEFTAEEHEHHPNTTIDTLHHSNIHPESLDNTDENQTSNLGLLVNEGGGAIDAQAFGAVRAESSLQSKHIVRSRTGLGENETTTRAYRSIVHTLFIISLGDATPRTNQRPHLRLNQTRDETEYQDEERDSCAEEFDLPTRRIPAAAMKVGQFWRECIHSFSLFFHDRSFSFFRSVSVRRFWEAAETRFWFMC
ncbi:hypothetical protein KIW84_023192 [Lathyrus oleraceus]|uniref:Retroviral polymerase SH3-like domain-containing protein n=1 Tax=Pisum sativum TaxID=3888 RepID=A0A9D4YEE0_PEA|nr:hypothetical protein KIW84_023192 [Pisum sativum]